MLLCLIPILASSVKEFYCVWVCNVYHSYPSLVWKSFLLCWVCLLVSSCPSLVWKEFLRFWVVTGVSIPVLASVVKEFQMRLSVLGLIPVFLPSCERVVFYCVWVCSWSHSCLLVWTSSTALRCYCVLFYPAFVWKSFNCVEYVTVSHSYPSLVWKSFYCVECVTVSHPVLASVWKSFYCVLLCLSVLLCLIPVLASCERVSSVFECVTVSHSCPSLVWKSFDCVWVCYCVSFLS